jgi:hypothetical protein
VIVSPAHAKLWVGVLLVAAAAIVIWRQRGRGARDLGLWLQLPVALLLYFGLFPPPVSLRGDALTVMAAGGAASQSRSLPRNQPVVVLPGAQGPALAESAPDLATALRRHPAVNRLTIIGGGLSARDRTAVAGRALSFQAAPAQGLLELHAPASVPVGRQWALSGRTASPRRRVELRDPGGVVVDAVDVDRAGRFALSATARGEGVVRFELRLLDGAHAIEESASVPLIVVGGTPINVIVRFGAVNAELKYWRRWATDAGLTFSVAAAITPGVSVRAGEPRLTTDSLARSDVVIIDARGWSTLDADEKAVLRQAVTHGLGLLLRADASFTPETLAEWRDLGFALAPTRSPVTVTLDQHLGLRDRTPFTAAAVTVTSPTSVVEFAADDGTPLAWWHDLGDGRIAVWRLVDSYRLILLGEPERYANLWASTLELLARPRAPAPPVPRLPREAWVLERTVLCGLGSAAAVRTPSEQTVGLTVDAGCAGYWPGEAGWHRLETGGGAWPFYVRAGDDGRSLRAALDAAATAALVTPEGDAATTGTHSRPPALHAPMARWPWLLGWLAVTALMWWWERRRMASRQ